MEQELIELIIRKLKISKEEFENVCGLRTAWESLQKVEILFEIEDNYNITFESDEILELDTPKKLIAITLKKVG